MRKTMAARVETIKKLINKAMCRLHLDPRQMAHKSI